MRGADPEVCGAHKQLRDGHRCVRDAQQMLVVINTSHGESHKKLSSGITLVVVTFMRVRGRHRMVRDAQPKVGASDRPESRSRAMLQRGAETHLIVDLGHVSQRPIRRQEAHDSVFSP